jgi:hypothetical protein
MNELEELSIRYVWHVSKAGWKDGSAHKFVREG